MKSSLKLVILFNFFKGGVVFELVVELFELDWPSIIRIGIFLFLKLVEKNLILFEMKLVILFKLFEGVVGLSG